MPGSILLSCRCPYSHLCILPRTLKAFRLSYCLQTLKLFFILLLRFLFFVFSFIPKTFRSCLDNILKDVFFKTEKNPREEMLFKRRKAKKKRKQSVDFHLQNVPSVGLFLFFYFLKTIFLYIYFFRNHIWGSLRKKKTRGKFIMVWKSVVHFDIPTFF